MGLEWVCGLLQPGFVRWAPPPLHKTTLTTDFKSCDFYLYLSIQSHNHNMMPDHHVLNVPYPKMLKIPSKNPRSRPRSGWLPKSNGDFLVQRYISRQNVRKDPISIVLCEIASGLRCASVCFCVMNTFRCHSLNQWVLCKSRVSDIFG